MGNQYNLVDLLLETYNYDDWFKNEALADKTKKSDKEKSVDLSDMPPLKDYGEVKERKGLKT